MTGRWLKVNLDKDYNMEIIKRGDKHLKTYIGTCSNCGSLFRADHTEVKVGFCRNEHYIEGQTCSVCGKHGVYFKEEKMNYGS